MLTQISISQFTVVEALDIQLASGLTVITGETGAGKSIMLDALGLCLGDKADPSAIRSGSERAEITAIFDVSLLAHVRNWLRDRDFDDGDECLLRRTLTREGRSRAYINGSPATLKDCATLGGMLIDIHGQHAHQSLLRRTEQRQLIDAYAGQIERAKEVAELAANWHETRELLTTLRKGQQEQADREQLLRYQVGELDELALADTELQRLEDEQRQLDNADAIQQQAAQAADLCEEHAAGARAALAELASELHSGKDVINVREMIDSASIQLEEARSELQAYLARCESNPQRLADVRARLEDIYSLARKHRVMPEALAAHHNDLSGELASLDSSDERLEELEQALTTLGERYTQVAGKLSTERETAAKRLERAVGKFLKKLAMANSVFRVALRPRSTDEPHALGSEDVDLLIATNPGAEPQPLGRIASGGELSRISLAIQVATSGKATVPSMVFDEVDVGIGGAVAEVVGKLLADMGDKSQVLCITHLPQVAAQGRHHLLVEKRGTARKMASTLVTLDTDQRVDEIARMLGGLKMTESTLAHAREMLADASI